MDPGALMEMELNENRYYRGFMEGMDESASSFYIDNLKSQLHKKKVFDRR